MVIHKKRVVTILLVITVLLLIPLIAMIFTNSVNWSMFDFAIAGIMLLAAGFTFEVIIEHVNKKRIRNILIVLLIVCFLLIWAELAVGVFGSPFAGS
ncbi:membrane protein [Mangrovimonas yunxiaonensis]|uniref:Membrane protein n=1 Tax=Mangrovimonas yunxiaonensis TaxID=1197477 RepID=A0A084TNV0_9FLAO|nr:hypothetical protein [Mangrovimonas yunxiaonensis]KFB02386.1 membrane protein [Mangrovimonas yunxiaonensis]GGH40026.1 hypothetical protein GCM10011364_09840 [Mangrovimonas yunxiaonensis]